MAAFRTSGRAFNDAVDANVTDAASRQVLRDVGLALSAGDRLADQLIDVDVEADADSFRVSVATAGPVPPAPAVPPPPVSPAELAAAYGRQADAARENARLTNVESAAAAFLAEADNLDAKAAEAQATADRGGN